MRGLAIRTLHWLTVPVLAVQLFIAFFLVGGMGTIRWLPQHVTLGAALLALTVLRLILRLGTDHQRRPAARVVHCALYVALVAVVRTGWLSYLPAPLQPPLQIFGAVPVPVLRWLPEVPWAALHRALVWTLLALIAIHLGAALLRFVRTPKAHAALPHDIRN